MKSNNRLKGLLHLLTTKKIIKLCRWSLMIKEGLCIIGLKSDSSKFASPCAKRRLDSFSILTDDSICILVGAIDEGDCISNGLSIEFINAFAHGFPVNWQDLVRISKMSCSSITMLPEEPMRRKRNSQKPTTTATAQMTPKDPVRRKRSQKQMTPKDPVKRKHSQKQLLPEEPMRRKRNSQKPTTTATAQMTPKDPVRRKRSQKQMTPKDPVKRKHSQKQMLPEEPMRRRRNCSQKPTTTATAQMTPKDPVRRKRSQKQMTPKDPVRRKRSQKQMTPKDPVRRKRSQKQMTPKDPVRRKRSQKQSKVAAEDDWNKEELNLLKEGLSQFSEDDSFFWQKIAIKVGSDKEPLACQRRARLLGKPTQLPKAKRKTVTSITSASQVTAKPGSLKRTRQIRELMENFNSSHSDDFFESTPYKGSKNMKLSHLDLSLEQSGYQKSTSTTPGSASSSSSFPQHFSWMPVSDLTPHLPDICNVGDSAKKRADVVIRDFKTSRRRKSARKIIHGNDYLEKDQVLDQVVFDHIDQSRQSNCRDSSESEDDCISSKLF